MTNYRPTTYQEPKLNENAIWNYIQGRTEVCVREIWTQALGYPIESKPTRFMSNLIIKCLNNFGWDKADRQRVANYGQQWVFVPTQPRYIQQVQTPRMSFQPVDNRADLTQATILLSQAVEILQRVCF